MIYYFFYCFQLNFSWSPIPSQQTKLWSMKPKQQINRRLLKTNADLEPFAKTSSASRESLKTSMKPRWKHCLVSTDPTKQTVLAKFAHAWTSFWPNDTHKPTQLRKETILYDKWTSLNDSCYWTSVIVQNCEIRAHCSTTLRLSSKVSILSNLFLNFIIVQRLIKVQSIARNHLINLISWRESSAFSNWWNPAPNWTDELVDTLNSRTWHQGIVFGEYYRCKFATFLEMNFSCIAKKNYKTL